MASHHSVIFMPAQSAKTRSEVTTKCSPPRQWTYIPYMTKHKEWDGFRTDHFNNADAFTPSNYTVYFCNTNHAQPQYCTRHNNRSADTNWRQILQIQIYKHTSFLRLAIVTGPPSRVLLSAREWVTPHVMQQGMNTSDVSNSTLHNQHDAIR